MILNLHLLHSTENKFTPTDNLLILNGNHLLRCIWKAYFYDFITTPLLWNYWKTENGKGHINVYIYACVYFPTHVYFLLGRCAAFYQLSEHLSGSGNTHVVGSQRHAASTAGAELGAAVGAEMAAPISKLCFVTDSTSRSIIFVLSLVTPCFFPYLPHLFFIAFKLLMQSPG